MAFDCRRCLSNTRRCEPPPGIPSMITRLLLPILLMTNLPAAAQAPTPPDVARKAHLVETPFGATRDDDYYWLRDDDRTDKAMLPYLAAENPSAADVLAPLTPLPDRLYDEIPPPISEERRL